MADDRQPPIITLTTDFGIGSRYIAALKGVILSINPHATIVDLSHSIPPRDIRAGAIVLAETAPWFPPSSIHVAVVDPGVGSNRRILYAHIGSQQFVAPDNGVLSRLAMLERPAKIVSIEEPRHWMPEVSRTFPRARYHGAGCRPAKRRPFARRARPPTATPLANTLGQSPASV